MSDEDKLFLTIHSWTTRYGHLVKQMSPDEPMKKMNELMAEEEGITY
jgi:hypothetical protein